MLFFFSFNGYGSALAFKEMSEKDISDVELYVREYLPSILTEALAENKITYSNKERSWFFGPFASKPASFYIPGGEKKVILRAVNDVRQIIGEPECGAELEQFNKLHFNSKEVISYEFGLINSVFGFVFGDTREIRKAEIDRKVDEMLKKLFERVKVIFEQYETDEIMPLRGFMIDEVHVSYNRENIPQCSINCIFCEENSLTGQIKAFYRSVGHGSWIVSNLVTHMERYHTPEGFQKTLAKRAAKRKPKNKKGIVPTRDTTNDVNNEIPRKHGRNAENTEDHQSQLIHLLVEPATEEMPDLYEFEQKLCFQIKQQVIKMCNSASKNNDKCDEICLYADAKGNKLSKMLKYCTVDANGDCLFLSLSHQIFDTKLVQNNMHKVHSK